MRHRWGVYLSRVPGGSKLSSLQASNELKPVRISGIRLFVTINGLIGDVSTNIRFHNHLPMTAPAVFLFPLTNSTSVKQCRAVITHRRDFTQRSVALECHQVPENEEPSKVGFVIEQSASNVVELQLGLISPGDEIEVTLQYAILFDVEEDGSVKFLFPTFLPRQLQSNYTELCAPEVYQTMDLQCRAVISGEYKIQKIVSDHRLDVNYRNGERRYVQIDTVGSYMLSKDFHFSIVYSDLNKPHVHIHSPIAKREETTHWLLSSYCAHLTLHHSSKKVASVHQKNEYILCIDRSGSMYGSKMQLVRDAVTYFIRYLQPGSYFNIISFGSTIRPLFKTSQKLTAYSAMKALKLGKSLRADMFGTNILGLLQHVYSQDNKTDSYRQVYLITDGGVEDPDSCVELVKRNSDNTRMFTFGLDKTASRYLVSNLARAGNGKSYHLINPHHLGNKVVEAMRLSAQASLTNLSVTVDLPSGMELCTQPDILPSVLFAEETMSVCLIISGQPLNDETQCKLVMVGRHEREKFQHIRYFDLRDAVVTHGSPLHQLSIKTHLHNLQSDVAVCRSADEILEIHKEMVDLSISSGVACKQTKCISVDSESRMALNDLPVTICRPEDNFSPHSSTGIDIFRSNQVMLKALMSRCSLSKGSVGSTKNSARQQSTNLQPLQIQPYSSHKHSEQKRTREINGQRFTTTNRLGRLESARIAEADSDSCRSSFLNTELDAMSFLKYDVESLPPDLFNIIEEYSDKGCGSQMSAVGYEAQRPSELVQLSKRVEGHSVSSTGVGDISPLKIASTSDYYSHEVSPVSDVLSYPGNTKKYSGKDYRRSDSLSSSGLGSNLGDSISDSSVQNFSIMTSCVDPLSHEKSVWKQYREQDLKDKRQINLEGRLVLRNPSLLDTLISEDPQLEEYALIASTPRCSKTITKDRPKGHTTHDTPTTSISPKSMMLQDYMIDVHDNRRLVGKCEELPQVCSQRNGNAKPHQADVATLHHQPLDGLLSRFSPILSTQYSPLHRPKIDSVTCSVPQLSAQPTSKTKHPIQPSPTHSSKSVVHATFDVAVHRPPLKPHHSPMPLNTTSLQKTNKAEIRSEQSAKEIPTNLNKQPGSEIRQSSINWKGREIKHLGAPRYGERYLVQPLRDEPSQSQNATTQQTIPLNGMVRGSRRRLSSELSENVSPKDFINSLPLMDDQTSTSDLSSLVREYWADKPKPTRQTAPGKLSKPNAVNEQKIPAKSPRWRNRLRNSFRRLKKLVSG